MSKVKTTVSLSESLFEQIDATAKEMRLTRSGVLTQAIEEYLRKRKREELLDQINTVYSDNPIDEQERAMMDATLAYQRHLIDSNHPDWAPFDDEAESSDRDRSE